MILLRIVLIVLVMFSPLPLKSFDVVVVIQTFKALRRAVYGIHSIIIDDAGELSRVEIISRQNFGCVINLIDDCSLMLSCKFRFHRRCARQYYPFVLSS